MDVLPMQKRLDDALAYGLLTWPLPFVWTVLPAGPVGGLLRTLLILWLIAIVAHAAQRYRAQSRFAAALLAGTGCIALAVWTHPSGWTWLWVVLAGFFHHTGQRVLLAPAQSTSESVVGSADEVLY